jgi:hypothetical protein
VVGDLLGDSRRCRGGITTMQVFPTKEASAPSIALHALPHCPTDLGSSTLEPPIPVAPLRPSATRRRPLPMWPLSPTAAHVRIALVRVAGRHAEAVAGEGLTQRRPGGAQLGRGGVDTAQLLGQGKARSASARSVRKRLGCQPRGCRPGISLHSGGQQVASQDNWLVYVDRLSCRECTKF